MKLVSAKPVSVTPSAKPPNDATVALLRNYLKKAEDGEISFCYLMYLGDDIGCELAGDLPEEPYQTMGYMHEMIDDFRAHYDMVG
jgi:hypothetical protein